MTASRAAFLALFALTSPVLAPAANPTFDASILVQLPAPSAGDLECADLDGDGHLDILAVLKARRRR